MFNLFSDYLRVNSDSFILEKYTEKTIDVVKTMVWDVGPDEGCDQLNALYALSLLKVLHLSEQENIPHLINQVPTKIKHAFAIATAVTRENFFKPTIFCKNETEFEQNLA